jgi:hypothetical protein
MRGRGEMNATRNETGATECPVFDLRRIDDMVWTLRSAVFTKWDPDHVREGALR